MDDIAIDRLGNREIRIVHSPKLLYFRERHSSLHGAVQGGVSHCNGAPQDAHPGRPRRAMDAAVAHGGKANGRARGGDAVPRDRESTGETSLHCTRAQHGVDTRAEQPAPCTKEEKTAK